MAMEGVDFILLGGGAGLSAAAGFTYSGKRFTENFGPFIDKYGFTDMYLQVFIRLKPKRKNGHTGQNISV